MKVRELIMERTPFVATKAAADFLDTVPGELEVVGSETADKVLDGGKEHPDKRFQVKMGAGTCTVRTFSWRQGLFARVESPDENVMYTKTVH